MGVHNEPGKMDSPYDPTYCSSSHSARARVKIVRASKVFIVNENYSRCIRMGSPASPARRTPLLAAKNLNLIFK